MGLACQRRWRGRGKGRKFVPWFYSRHPNCWSAFQINLRQTKTIKTKQTLIKFLQKKNSLNARKRNIKKTLRLILAFQKKLKNLKLKNALKMFLRSSVITREADHWNLWKEELDLFSMEILISLMMRIVNSNIWNYKITLKKLFHLIFKLKLNITIKNIK